MILEIDDVDDFLEHHGIRGQKWGIRNQRRANNKIMVGKGSKDATVGQKIRAYTDVGPIDLARGHGFRGAALRKGKRQIAAGKAVHDGNATARQWLTRVGMLRQQDVIPTKKGSHNTRAALGASIAGAIVIANANTILKLGTKALVRA